MTNCAAVVAVVMATSFLLVTVWSKQVPFHVCAIFWNVEQRHTTTSLTTFSLKTFRLKTFRHTTTSQTDLSCPPLGES